MLPAYPGFAGFPARPPVCAWMPAESHMTSWPAGSGAGQWSATASIEYLGSLSPCDPTFNPAFCSSATVIRAQFAPINSPLLLPFSASGKSAGPSSHPERTRAVALSGREAA